MEAFGKVPGGRCQDNGADTNQNRDTVERDEHAADALQKSEDQAGPTEPPKRLEGNAVDSPVETVESAVVGMSAPLYAFE